MVVRIWITVTSYLSLFGILQFAILLLFRFVCYEKFKKTKRAISCLRSAEIIVKNVTLQIEIIDEKNK